LRDPGNFNFGYPEVQARTWPFSTSPGGRHASAETERYFAERNAVIDRLLPEGAGGTRFFEHLGGASGRAATDAAAIALSVAVCSEPWPESVELHERAHLLEAFLPGETANLMTRLATPVAGEYAATNRAEHFAEMAARAWQVLVPPVGMCVDGTPGQQLRDIETRVPGTAGFVAWYMQQSPLGGGEGRGELMADAAELSAPQRAEWNALWKALDGRRRTNGTFTPWRHDNIRHYLEARQVQLRSTGGWIDCVAAALLVPSLTLLRLSGQ
jgi:hypothetical protein